MTYSHGFPWNVPLPDARVRVVFAIIVGLIAAALHYLKPGESGGLSDFSGLWYGSKILIDGGNPYEMIGPNRQIPLPSNLYYPAPALVAVIPLTVVSPGVAGAVFVFLSSALLAFGLTVEGWYRVPMLLSVSFFTAARLGQWSILMTAAVFVPAIAMFSIAKPQASLPVLVSTRSVSAWKYALSGAFVLCLLSLILFPGWFDAWSSQIGSSEFFHAPILSWAGIPIALVLLRWRRPEAWLVFSSACLPQTWYPYNALILMAVASTYREACVLSIVSSVAWLAAYAMLPGDPRSFEAQSMFRAVLIAWCYLPATIVVLRRTGDDRIPVWMKFLARNRKQREGSRQQAEPR